MKAREESLTQHEERYHEAVASYLRSLDAGSNPNRDEWLKRYPEVATQLAAFFVEPGHHLLREIRPPHPVELVCEHELPVEANDDQQENEREPPFRDPGVQVIEAIQCWIEPGGGNAHEK